ncbi:MAG: zinc dependent phospholipase C family protein [Christensenellaceae bacterium]|jgi:hypothetical protein|nr:zinc dependent phospholipase C family protein [Christensenellaceae bacterium]
MPGNAFHYHFANDVYEHISQEIRDDISVSMPSYQFGGQGPDILFYLKILRGLSDTLGTSVHLSSKTQQVFEESARFVQSHNYPAILPFLYGQLCHYALDKNVHPFVYFREKDSPKFCEKGLEPFYHVAFESAMDYICITEYIKQDIKTYDSTAHVRLDESSAQQIGEYYQAVVAPIFNDPLKCEDIVKCIKYMKKALKLLDDHKGKKYTLFKFAAKLVPKAGYLRASLKPRVLDEAADYMNRKKSPYLKYRNVSETLTLSVDEMYQTAVQNAVILINAFHQTVKQNAPLDASLFEINYAGDLLSNT